MVDNATSENSKGGKARAKILSPKRRKEIAQQGARTRMNPRDLHLKEKVVSLYEHCVILSGLLFTNINGEVTEAKVEDISERKMAVLLKDASEVTGIWDLTGGVDPVEHVRRMRE